MLRDITRNKSSQLLIDFVVLVVAVHSPYVVYDIFVNHRSEPLILQAHLGQEKLYAVDWQ